jgi:hypothetical protein
MTRVPGTGSRRSPPYSPGSSPRRSKGAWRWPRAGARVRLPGREPEADAVTSRGRRQAHVEGFDLTPVCGYRPMIAPAGSLWAAMYSAPRRPQDTRHQGWGGPLTIGPKLLLPPRRDIAAASRDCHRINRWASPEGRHWPAGPATDQDRGRWPSHAARRRMPRTCTPKAFASLGSPRWRAAQTARTTAGSICVSAGCRDERLTRPGATQRETESRLKVRA